jgi:choline dehydrogenase-like flavoprotein
MPDTHDLVVAGTGPASTFFLLGWLEHAPARARVLVLERGPALVHGERLADHEGLLARSTRTVRMHGKRWKFGLAVGGTSHLWWGCTPRLLPEDFELHARYRVGRDWPLRYRDLERWYCRAEELMGVAGDGDDTPFERSRPYPLPAHRFMAPDRLLKEAFPDAFFHQPCARPTAAIGSRPSCCNNGVCGLCPIDSKFTVVNALAHVLNDPRVQLETDARVDAIEIAGGTATGVVWRRGDVDRVARAPLVALGANALFNPVILARSGLDHPLLGRGLHEQVSVRVDVWLAGVDAFQGSTSITGHGYMLYGGEHRRTRAAALIETWNVPTLRMQPGRWRQNLRLQVIYEDLPNDAHRVEPGAGVGDPPQAHFSGISDYAQRALDRLPRDLEHILAPLPVERIRLPDAPRDTEGHILGTTRMSRSPRDGIVDRDLVHHRVRNLLVLGGSAFPTCSPANPTLTIAALSLRAADRLVGRAPPALPPQGSGP